MLVINFFDKSVDLGELDDLDNFRDYIGSVRIPLKVLDSGDEIGLHEDVNCPVINHLNQHMGSCHVRLSFASPDYSIAYL